MVRCSQRREGRAGRIHSLRGSDRPRRDPRSRAPGPLADLLGATVDQHECLPEQAETRVAERDGRIWVTNFGSDPVTVETDGEFVVGDADVDAFGVAVVEGSVGDVRVERA